MMIKTPQGPWIRAEDVMLITTPQLTGSSGTTHSIQVHFKSGGSEGTKYTFTFDSLTMAHDWIDKVVERINEAND